MKSWFKHPLRVTGRLLWLSVEFAFAAFTFLGCCAFRSRADQVPARAAWLQHHSRRVLRLLRLEAKVAGEIPSRGLLVSNHLSYLDIFVLAALSPCVFVSKREVKYWPVFGCYAQFAGTVFVHRERRAATKQVTDAIEAVLGNGVLVVLFPEGTSSGGETVLPFKSSLLEPAARSTQPLAAGLIQYELEDGDVSEEVCYWKNMTLVPHLINLLSKRGIKAFVRFTSLREGCTDRKELARRLHSEVLKLKTPVAVS